MTKRLIASCILFAASPAVAHDFWIQPRQFQVRPDEPLPFTFQVGHGKSRDRWGNNQRIVALTDFFGSAKSDRRGDLRNAGPADLVAAFRPAGLHILAMQTNHAFSELPAARFNDYLKEEGLTSIIAFRQRAGSTGAAGRERYSRRAKTLIQVGAVTPSNQALATRPIGLKLEIVADRSPYALDASRMLPVHVLYRGRRLPNATVKLTRLGDDERPFATTITDRTGRASFRVPANGAWLLNVVWAEPVRGDAKIDFDTTFSSMTFGYAPVRRPR